MFRVLIVDGDRQYVDELRERITAEGYTPVVVHGTEEALQSLAQQATDIILVDLDEERFSPADLHRLLDAGKERRTPFLALVKEDRVGRYDFTSDIDDFAVKSHNMREIITRVKQIRWRRDRVESKDIVKRGDLVLDLAKYEVTLAGKMVTLTFTEYELLKYLATNSGRVINRETLLSKVWGYDYFGGTRTVDVHIRKLRSKIEDSTHSFIETVRNVGYRFKKD